MEITLEIYQKAKKDSTPKGIRSLYMELYEAGLFVEPYRMFYQKLSMFHNQEKMRVERENEKALGSGSLYLSVCPQCGHQRTR